VEWRKGAGRRASAPGQTRKRRGLQFRPRHNRPRSKPCPAPDTVPGNGVGAGQRLTSHRPQSPTPTGRPPARQGVGLNAAARASSPTSKQTPRGAGPSSREEQARHRGEGRSSSRAPRFALPTSGGSIQRSGSRKSAPCTATQSRAYWRLKGPPNPRQAGAPHLITAASTVSHRNSAGRPAPDQPRGLHRARSGPQGGGASASTGSVGALPLGPAGRSSLDGLETQSRWQSSALGIEARVPNPTSPPGNGRQGPPGLSPVTPQTTSAPQFPLFGVFLFTHFVFGSWPRTDRNSKPQGLELEPPLALTTSTPPSHLTHHSPAVIDPAHLP